MYELRKEITALYFVVTVNHLLSAPPAPLLISLPFSGEES